MEVHVYHHLDPRLERKLDRVLHALLKNEEIIMAQLDTLTADVAADTDAVNSAVKLIEGLVQQIKDAGTDPVALKALTDRLEANTASLAGAVAANTSAAPVPVPPVA